MIDLLKLIRIPNLIVIALTQVLMRYFVIQPFLKVNNSELQLSTSAFVCLVLATVFLAAGAYIINDYFDVKGDRINKRMVVVGKNISRRLALFYHFLFHSIAICLGIYASVSIGIWQLSLIFPMASGFLWFYSTSYKYNFLFGNILVSLLAAAIPFMVVVYEIPMLNKAYMETLLATKTNFNYLFYWVGAFSFFAFVGVLLAQFLRDMRSTRGDMEINRRSLSLVLGIGVSKAISIIISLGICISIFALWYSFLRSPNDSISLWYFIVFLILPLLILCVKIFTYQENRSFTFGEGLLKGVLLAGISYTLVVNYILTHINL